MNVNLPDILWTIICFALFTLVLNGLLIKPVLKLMDERKAKISGARERARALEQARLEERQKRLLEAEEAERLRGEEALRLLNEAAESSREELRLLSEELNASEAEQLQRIAEEAAQYDEKLLSAMDGMVEAFTDKLVTGGES